MLTLCSLTVNVFFCQGKFLFDSLFSHLEVHPSHYDPSFQRDHLHTRKDYTCIIDTPEVTLGHPMLDFNATQEAESILRGADATAGNRKSFHALMSGRGTGKTRTICELRAELLKNHFNCLPVAITFNFHWKEFYFRSATGDATKKSTLMNLALDIVIRMASILYGKEPIDLLPIMKRKGNLSQLKSLSSIDLITGFIEHAVSRVRMKGKEVNYFIFLIDESLRFTTGIKGDAFTDSRRALLETIFSGNLRTNMVMTALAAAPIGRTTSGRSVCPIKKPSKLPVEQTLLRWLKMTPTASSRLLLALLAPIPRSVQVLYDEVLKVFFSGQEISANNFPSIFQRLNERLAVVFKDAKFPSDELLFQTLFFDNILFTKEVESMITHSVFTNVESGAEFGVSEIYPEPSILIMYASLVKAQYSELAGQFKKTIESTLRQLSIVREDSIGSVHEVLYFEYLCLRILSLNGGKRKVNPAQLLGIPAENLFDNRLRDLLESNLSRFRSGDLMKTKKTTLPALSAADDFNQFLRELRTDLSIGLWRAAEGDPFDCLLMLRVDDYADPFFFFIELKSPDVWPDDEDRKEEAFKKRTQYNRSQMLIERVLERLPDDAQFKRNGFLYAYFVAKDNVASKIYKNNSRVVISGTEAKRFLRCFRDFYKAIRGLISDPIAALEDSQEEALKPPTM